MIVNFRKYSSINQILYLFSRDQQFESHKPQGYWRLIWSLTSGSVELLKTYMVVNFRVHGISRGTRRLTRIPMLIKKITKFLKVSNFFEDPRRSTIEIKNLYELVHRKSIFTGTQASLCWRAGPSMADPILYSPLSCSTSKRYTVAMVF